MQSFCLKVFIAMIFFGAAVRSLLHPSSEMIQFSCGFITLKQFYHEHRKITIISVESSDFSNRHGPVAEQL